jgi:hypothetical protein
MNSNKLLDSKKKIGSSERERWFKKIWYVSVLCVEFFHPELNTYL